MERYTQMIKGYERQQIKLRAQITSLKAGKSDAGRTGMAATIRRLERQIADLSRAIARLRQASPT
ncbi:MAG TPA: hypothetical protein VMJ64_11480 [Anaerolineales bacterium]|nr:hypothetical protein [Anaerolineales bacterium]